MEFALYYDEDYRAKFLGRHAEALKNHLEPQGFRRLNAEELASWMKQRLNDRTAPQSSVVFCQDAVPDTIFPEGVDCANVLLRRYLDQGGRIVWLGDIPLWYRARKRPKGDEPWQKDDEPWQYGVPLAILGVMPLFADSSSLSEWVDALKLQMKSRWYGMRPVALETARTFQGLKITPLAYVQVTLMPSSYNMLMISRWKKAGKKVSQVSAQIGVSGLNLGGGLSLSEQFPKELGIDKPLKLACAWHVRFNEKYPAQGFYRFLDSETDEVGSEVLKDIEQLAKLEEPIS